MSGTTSITGVATVGIPVTDQDRALEFYVGQLGFEARRDVPFGDGRWIESPRRGGDDHRPCPRRDPHRHPSHHQGRRHRPRRTPGRGVDTDPEVMRIPSAPAMFAVRDPDGNSLILVEGE